MLMGSLLIIGGSFLYWLLKPPALYNSILKEDVVFPKNPSLEGEAVAKCLTSQPYTR